MQVLLKVQFLHLNDYLLSQVFLGVNYAVFCVLCKDFHETQVVQEILWKLVLLIVPENSEQDMKEFFAVKCWSCEYVPYFVCNGLSLFGFDWPFDLNDVSEGDNEMFLEIMKTRFLSFFGSEQVLFVLHAEDWLLFLNVIVWPFQMFGFWIIYLL